MFKKTADGYSSTGGCTLRVHAEHRQGMSPRSPVNLFALCVNERIFTDIGPRMVLKFSLMIWVVKRNYSLVVSFSSQAIHGLRAIKKREKAEHSKMWVNNAQSKHCTSLHTTPTKIIGTIQELCLSVSYYIAPKCCAAPDWCFYNKIYHYCSELIHTFVAVTNMDYPTAISKVFKHSPVNR